jgi:hypothetical protein
MQQTAWTFWCAHDSFLRQTITLTALLALAQRLQGYFLNKAF